jgi:coenzyme Q-binding protein COQ10
MAALTRRGAGRLPSAGFALGGCGSRRSYLANFGGVDLRRTFQHQKVVRYPVSTIYNAVASVDEYSEFLPWCLSSRVLARKSNAASDDGSPTPAEEKLKTEIEVGIASLSAQFGSTVTLLPNERVHAVSEPNKYLENLIFTWQFAPIGEQVRSLLSGNAMDKGVASWGSHRSSHPFQSHIPVASWSVGLPYRFAT